MLYCTSTCLLANHPIPAIQDDLCDLDLEVPEDDHLCQEGLYNLCGSYTSSNPVQLEWLKDGRSTNLDLCDEVYIDEDVVFTLIGTYVGEDNLIINGDFENGDDGSFTTDYTPGQGNCIHGKGYLGCEGYYEVMDNPRDGHADFSSCGDHTSGGGNMLVLNGAPSLQELWCQDICVDPDLDYLFSAWGASVHRDRPAQLQFSVDGNLIGNILTLSNTTCEWEEFSEQFSANGSSQIEICITNQNTIAGGNDFAIDDISLFPICTVEESVEITVSDLELEIDEPDPIDCIYDTVEIEVDIDSSTDIDEILWSSEEGTIIGDADVEEIIVASEGLYTVTVTDEYSCTSTAEVMVIEEIDIPEIEILGDTLLNCADTSLVLSVQSNQNNLRYYWQDSLGMTIGRADTLSVNSAGLFTLIIEARNSGCQNTDTIEISLDTLGIDFDLVKSNDFNCSVNSVLISTTTAQDSVSWRSANGTIIPTTDDSLLVTIPDTYYAEVLSPNGCFHIDTIDILEIQSNFIYQSNYDNVLSCDNPSSAVQVDFDPNTFSFNWVGSAASYGSNPDIQLTEGGTYYYELTDSNGCVKPDSIVLAEDFFTPNISAEAGLITCATGTTDITLLWADPTYIIDEVIWQFPDGTSVSDDSNISTNQQGWTSYLAFVSRNGCNILDSIFVDADNDFPAAMIVGDTLTCNNSMVTLNAEVSADVNAYTWLFPDGTQQNGSILETNQEGNYTLIVSNDSGCRTTATYQIETDYDTPEITLEPELILDCNNPILSVDVEVDSDYSSANWTGPETDEAALSLEVSEAGSYYLEVIGLNGCIALDTLQVDIDTIPTDYILEAPQQLNCATTAFSPVITQDNNDNRTFIWETPNGELINHDDLIITSPGTYLLTAIGSNGCPTTATYLVGEAADLPEFEAQATVITCDNPITTISANSDQNNLRYIYVDPLTNEELGSGNSLELSGYDNLQVIATDPAGCSDVIEVSVYYDTISPQFSIIADVLTCTNSAILPAVSGLANQAELNLYNENGILLGDEKTTITEGGTYLYTATNINGCSSEVMFTISTDTTTIQFSLDADIIDCNDPDTEIAINTSEDFQLAYLADDNGLVIDSLTNANIFEEITIAGQYSVALIAENGCVSTANVEVLSDGDLVNFSLSSVPITCNNLETTIDIITSENYNDAYAIYLPTQEVIQNLTTAEISVAGNYEVHLYSDSGCESIQQIEILEDVDIPEVTLLDLKPADCTGNNQINQLEITGGSPPYNIRLNGEPIADWQSIIPVPSTGNHTLTIEDNNGCISDYEFNIDPVEEIEGTVRPEVLIESPNDREVQVILNKPLDDIAQISWTPQTDLSCYDCLTPTFLGDTSSSYELYVEDLNGCSTLLSVTFIFREVVVEEPVRIYIPNIIDRESRDNNRFTIYTSEEDVEQINFLNIYDRWGNLVFRNENFSPNDPILGWDGRINNQLVNPGVFIYYTEVAYENGKAEVFAGDVTIL